MCKDQGVGKSRRGKRGNGCLKSDQEVGHDVKRKRKELPTEDQYKQKHERIRAGAYEDICQENSTDGGCATQGSGGLER